VEGVVTIGIVAPGTVKREGAIIGKGKQ